MTKLLLALKILGIWFLLACFVALGLGALMNSEKRHRGRYRV